MNVDNKEIERFSAQAHSWWDKSGSMKPLHALNPIRLDWINQHVRLQGKRVLDVGCGGGILSESMAVLGANVLGIDLAEKSLRVAQLHAMEQGVSDLQYEAISVEELAVRAPASYDAVTCMEMLEHVPSPGSVVQACAQLVKPGGWVFFSTLNRNVKAFGLAIVAAEYVLKLLPRGTHEYAKFIRPSELVGFVEQFGLEMRDLKGLHYSPLTQRFSIKPEADVNYLLAAQRPA